MIIGKLRCVQLLICVIMFIAHHSIAQAPEKMSYQAVIRDSNDNLIINQVVGMRVSLIQEAIDGMITYIEKQNPTTNTNGLISIEIGGGIVVSGSFNSIDWAKGPYFIKTEIDLNGGTDYTITGISQLLSVPYALHAKIAESVSGDILETDPVFSTSVANGITRTDTSKWNSKQNLLIAGSNIRIVDDIISSTAGTGSEHYIGELFGGGIVVAIWKDNGIEKGLIASLTDIGSTSNWSSNTGTIIGSAAQSPVNGKGNTAAIIEQGDISGAAYLCSNYTSDGFSDWYLPAIWELYHCFNAALVVNEILGDSNGFQPDSYCSSTEVSITVGDQTVGFVRSFNFGFGSGSNSGKNNNFRVRAVRRF